MKAHKGRLAAGCLLAAVILLSTLFSIPVQAASEDLGKPITVTTSASAAGVKNHSKKGLQFGNANQTLSFTDYYVSANKYNTENIYLHLNLVNLVVECQSKDEISYLYSYNGKHYAFNPYLLSAYNGEYFKLHGGQTLSIVLVSSAQIPGLTYCDKEGAAPSGAAYFALNTWDKQSKANLQKVLKRIADEIGKYVDYWILGNEVDCPSVYNEMGVSDVKTYAKNYTELLRMTYNAMSKKNSKVAVLVPFDQGWTHKSADHFSSKEILDIIKSQTAKNDFNWGVALHPYPVDLMSADWWNDSKKYPLAITRSESTDMYTMENIEYVTGAIAKNYQYKGKRRPILVTEVGFNALTNGVYNEDMQAASLAYAYYKAEADPNLDVFIYNALTDDWGPDEDPYQFGLCKKNSIGATPKKAFYVYLYMDTTFAPKYTDACLKTLGASSWTDLVPGLKMSAFQRTPRLAKASEVNSPEKGRYVMLGGAALGDGEQGYTGLVKINGSNYYSDRGYVDMSTTGTIYASDYNVIVKKGVVTGCAAKITEYPDYMTKNTGEEAVFTAKANGDDVKITWYTKKTTDASYSKAGTGNRLTVKATEGNNGLMVYCSAKDRYGNTEESYPVMLTVVKSSISLTTQPADTTVRQGEQFSFKAGAKGSGLTYTWYYKKTADANFIQANTKSAAYKGTADMSMNGMIVYCVISAKDGSTVTTRQAVLNVSTSPFKDVTEKDSYYSAVIWASDNGIVSGVKPNYFAPHSPCTRYQFAVMLYRLYGKPSVAGMQNPFKDVPKSKSYYDAVTWAYNRGIISGTAPDKFSPNATITRYQVVKMLYKAAGQPALVTGTENFKDVSPSDSFYNAVVWAVENKITNGTRPDTFSPQANCERYQMVVFLNKFNNIYHIK